MISQCDDAPNDGLCQVSNQSYRLSGKHTVSTETVASENSIETLQMSDYGNIVMQSFSFNILDIGGNDDMFNDIRKCLQISPSLMDGHCFLYSIVKSCHSQLTPSCAINVALILRKMRSELTTSPDESSGLRYTVTELQWKLLSIITPFTRSITPTLVILFLYYVRIH